MNRLKIIGHRGAAGLAPENTLASIEAALEVGVDAIEVDVRTTADGVIILNHDPFVIDIRHYTQLKIREYPFEALKQAKPDLATLADALALANGRCPLLIELKPDEPTEPLFSLLHDRIYGGMLPDSVALLSFSQRILKAAHTRLPGVPLVVNEKWSGVRGSRRARSLGTHRINMNARWLWLGFVRCMHRRGYDLAPYTVNRPGRIRRWQPYLYGVITDHPERFV